MKANNTLTRLQDRIRKGHESLWGRKITEHWIPSTVEDCLSYIKVIEDKYGFIY